MLKKVEPLGWYDYIGLFLIKRTITNSKDGTANYRAIKMVNNLFDS